jgi:aspartate/methionine/tyrosine aminotransferase
MAVLRKVNEKADAGDPVLSLAVGQPGAPLPAAMRELISQAGNAGQFGYTDALGTMKLREAIARWHTNRYGDHVEPAQIAVTNGASGGFTLAFLAAVPKGGSIGIAVPGYPAYRNIIKALGYNAVEIRVDQASRWCLTADRIRQAHTETGLDAVLVASPANPTGTMLSPEDLRAAVSACQELGIRSISDEIYHGLAYGDVEEATARPMAGDGDDGVIVINSFSKYFCMTGWRIGWMVMPRNMLDLTERLAQNLVICPPDLSQRLACSALEQADAFDEIKAGYAANRALLQQRLPAMGFEGMLPIDGAFYAYVPVSRFANDSVTFCARMLDEIHVAATPGIDFDPEQGHTMMRMSFAGTRDVVASALDRMERWLA